MYTLVSAIGKSRFGDKRWASVSIGDMPVSTIYAQYSRAYAELSNPFYDENVAVDLAALQGEYGGLSVTFNELLVSLGNTALPTIEKMPVIKPKYARWNDGFLAQYSIQPVSPDYSASTDVPDEDRTWLLMTNAAREVDYTEFYRRCLVSVNGYYHRIEGNSQGVYVHDGMKTGRQANQNQIGIYSFANVGKLQYVPITDAMVSRNGEDQPLRSQMRIDLGQDISQKTVMLVLGGYLHVLDQHAFWPVSETAILVDIQNLPILDRYFESRNTLDYSSLGLNEVTTNESQVAINQLFSDAALRAYATLSQSFVVLLDNPDIFVEHGSVQATHIPGQYISHVRPEWPLVLGHGKVAEYWAVEERITRRIRNWGINVLRSGIDKRVYATTSTMDLQSVSDQRLTIHPVQRANAHFLKIGTDM